MEELALLARQREDRDEGQQDDGHREEHRPPNQPRGVAHGLQHAPSIARIDGALLDVAKGVLGDDNAGINEHTDRDGDPGEAHDVRGDARVVHAEE